MTQTALTREQVMKASGAVLDVMVAVHILKEPVAPLYLPMIMRDKRYYFIPEYSTDISAAWEVEERVDQLSNRQGPLLRAYYMTELSLIVGSTFGFNLAHASAEARCKAALLAVLDL